MDVDAPSLRPGLAPQDILKGYTRRDSKAEEGAFRRSGGGRRERGQAPRRLGASPLSLGRTFSYTLSDRGTSLATARPALAPRLERLPRKAAGDSRLPDIRMALYDTAVTVDHQTGAVELRAHDLLGEGALACKRRLGSWWRRLRSMAPSPIRSSQLGPLASNFTRRAYLESVTRALE